MANKPAPERFTYYFIFDDNKIVSHEIILKEDGHSSVDLVSEKDMQLFSNFTRLDNNQCENCPLNIKDSPRCPAAENLASVINTFRKVKSYEKVKIEVETNARTYSFYGDLTKGLHSLVGLAMASSQCPHMKFLRPMARFHLPFATSTETILRSMSFHLLRGYLTDPENKIDFAPLFVKYGEVEKINQAMMERIRSFEVNDTGMHAIVMLDSFISIFGLKYDSNLTELKDIFDVKVADEAKGPGKKKKTG